LDKEKGKGSMGGGGRVTVSLGKTRKNTIASARFAGRGGRFYEEKGSKKKKELRENRITLFVDNYTNGFISS